MGVAGGWKERAPARNIVCDSEIWIPPLSWARGTRSGTPFGVLVRVGAVYRGCRFARPPANFWSPFRAGVGGFRGRPTGDGLFRMEGPSGTGHGGPGSRRAVVGPR